MGYMGFGMRKEVYQRKPKRSFQKLKELYGNDTLKVEHNAKLSTITTDDVLNKSRFKALRDRKGFKIFKIVLFFLILSYIVNSVLVQPWLFERKKRHYEKQLISRYDSDVDNILNSGKILRGLVFFQFDSLDYYSIVLTKNMKYPIPWGSKTTGVIQVGLFGASVDGLYFLNDTLVVSRSDSIQKFDNQWMIKYNGNGINETYGKILAHINVESSYVDSLKRGLRKKGFGNICYSEEVTSLSLGQDSVFGQYEFVRTKAPEKTDDGLVEIDSLTYLHRM